MPRKRAFNGPAPGPTDVPDRRPTGVRNVPARTQWHRDLIRWNREGLGDFVAFLTEDTARAVAARAEADTGARMRVFTLRTEDADPFADPFWCYQPHFEIQNAREDPDA